MADIFISYARADRDKIEKLASALEAEGYSVWWDRQIIGGSEFADDIERELATAKAVIVGWSDAGSKSKWVKDEASIAADASKLIAVSLDGADPPIGYRQYHCLDLKSWKGASDEGAFVDVARAAAARIKGETPPAAQFDRDGAQRNPAKVLIAAGTLALAAMAAGWYFINSNANAPTTDIVQEPVTSISEKSIAVLPFKTLSNDESDEYFGKGVAEELLNALAKFPELRVAARTSTFSFEGQDIDLRDIGSQLGVAHVLEGSVRRSGERLRITAQLIRAEDSFHLWSNTYEKGAADIFEIEDEIVRDISRALEVRLGVGAGTGRASGEGVQPLAYEEYLRGLTLWGERDRNPENRLEALKAFQRATGFDPDFADAWAAIGIVGAYSYPFNVAMSAEDFRAMTEEAFDKTLALDPDNAAVHAGLVPWRLGQPDIGAAKSHMERALEIAPNRADTHYMAAIYWMAVGDTNNTDSAFQRAITLDPLNMIMRRTYAIFLSSIGRFEEAFAFNDECRLSQCLGEGFLAYGLYQAIYSGDANRIETWLPYYEKLEAIIATFPDARKPPPMFVMPAAISIATQRPDVDARVHTMRAYLADHLVAEDIGMWGPIVAPMVPADMLLDAIEAVMVSGEFVRTPQNMAPFYGTNPWPEEIIRHPRYRALWAKPGMAELAAARRTNGWEDGLPLPIDGGEGEDTK